MTADPPSESPLTSGFSPDLTVLNASEFQRGTAPWELNQAAHDLIQRFPVPARRALPRFTTSRAQATVAIGTLATGVSVLSWRAARSAPGSPALTAYAAATLLLAPALLEVRALGRSVA